jgi:hypothetical protein
MPDLTVELDYDYTYDYTRIEIKTPERVHEFSKNIDIEN